MCVRVSESQDYGSITNHPSPHHTFGKKNTHPHSLHFRTDAPLDLKVLFFVPSFHGEKFGMGRLDPGVSLYSRKVNQNIRIDGRSWC